MAKTDDMRFVRTEKAIRAAFMKLVAESPVAKLTASAVCRQAGISRNAFYLHHASVAELYGALIGELVDDVRAESVASAQRRMQTGADDAFYEAIIASLARHEELLRALLPSDDGSLAKCLADGIEKAFVEAALHFGKHGGSFEHRLHCAYSAGALVGFVTCWIKESEQPLIGGLASFRELNESTVEVSARFLLGASKGVAAHG